MIENGTTGDSWDAIEADLAEVYGFRKDERPQDRAHAYIERRRVGRGFNDTALQVAATDLCRRARAIGAAEARLGMPEIQSIAAEITEASGRLLGIAVDLRAVRPACGKEGE